MNSQTINLSDKSYITIDPCPRNYFGDDKKTAERVQLFTNGEKVLTWDVYMNDDTRFTLYMEVETNYRSGEWLNVIAECDPLSLQRFNRKYAVWTNSGEAVVKQESTFAEALKTFNKRNVLTTSVALAHGQINKIIDLTQEKDDHDH